MYYPYNLQWDLSFYKPTTLLFYRQGFSLHVRLNLSVMHVSLLHYEETEGLG